MKNVILIALVYTSISGALVLPDLHASGKDTLIDNIITSEAQVT